MGKRYSSRSAKPPIKIQHAVIRILVPRQEQRGISDFFRGAEAAGGNLAEEVLGGGEICGW